MNNKVLIVAGMHRSGTSLVTQWLYRCGLNVGEHLLGKGIGNDDGHYEDLEFYNFHLNLLQSKNLHDSGFVETPVPGMTESDKENALKLINKKNSANSEWGWKDPRTCLFLRDYNKLIPNAHYIVVFRSFESTVSSVITRAQKVLHSEDKKVKNDGFFTRFFKNRSLKKEIKALSREQAGPSLKIWMLYNREILKFLDTIDFEKYLVLNYDLLLKNDSEIFERLKKVWNYSISYISFSDVYKPSLISKDLNIRNFVDEQLYQEACDLEEMLKSRLLVK